MKVYVVRTKTKIVGLFDRLPEAEEHAHTRARWVEEHELETAEDRLAVEREAALERWQAAFRSHDWRPEDDDYGSYDGTFCTKCRRRQEVLEFGRLFRMGRREFEHCPGKRQT